MNSTPLSFDKLLNNIIIQIINPLIMLLAAATMVLFLYEVYKLISKADSDTEKVDAQRGIMGSFVGLIVIFGVYGILNVVSGTFNLGKVAPITPVPTTTTSAEGFNVKGIGTKNVNLTTNSASKSGGLKGLYNGAKKYVKNLFSGSKSKDSASKGKDSASKSSTSKSSGLKGMYNSAKKYVKNLFSGSKSKDSASKGKK